MYRWDVFGQKPPNLTDRSSWYTTKIILGELKAPDEQLSSQTEAKWVDTASVSSPTHLRKSASRLMDFLELPWDQVKPLLLTLCNSLFVRFRMSMSMLYIPS